MRPERAGCVIISSIQFILAFVKLAKGIPTAARLMYDPVPRSNMKVSPFPSSIRWLVATASLNTQIKISGQL